jgi:hypothetical protein
VSAEDLRHLGRCVLWALATRSSVRRVAAGSWPRREYDDLRLVGLKLVFLVVTRAVSMLGLSRRESWRKDAEILMLRHQLAVAERERPRAHSRLAWPDRAWLALPAGTLPTERLAGMRLIVTPGTIVRWHRDIVRRRWACRSRQGKSGRPPTGRNVRTGDPGAGLLHRRPAQRRQGLRPCRDRAPHPPRVGSGRRRASGPGLGGAACQEPAHGPRGRRNAGEVRSA